MRYLFTFLLLYTLIPLSSASSPEKGTIEVCLKDTVNNEPLDGAVVRLVSLPDSISYHAVAYDGGKVTFHNLPYGNYHLEATFLGYTLVNRRIRLNKPLLILDTIWMQASSQLLNEVVITTQALRSSLSGDTLTYKADSYKVALGANSESLIMKMPGIAVSDQGVEAHGRNVQKIMIDGEDFFGNDVLSALKNIPADMIDNVEVFNKLSDEAQLTGVDDGRGITAINITTKSDRRRGTFGRLYGAYGIADKYVAGGNMNVFKTKQRLSIIGLANNISLHNFVTEDIVGATESSPTGNASNFVVKPLAGLSSVQSLGFNLNNSWFSGSYFFNRVDNANHSSSNRENLMNEEKTQLTDSEGDFDALNFNHRFNAKINLNFGRKHSIIIRPSINIQNNSDNREQTMATHNRVNTELRFVHNRITNNQNDRLGQSLSNSINYRYKFNKKGRSIALNIFGSYYHNDLNANSEQYTFQRPEIPLDPALCTSQSLQETTRMQQKTTIRTGLTYTEPLTRKLRMSWEYAFIYNLDKVGKRVFLYDKENEVFSDVYDERQSSENSGTYLTHKIGPRLHYTFRKTFISFSTALQHMDFGGKSIIPTAPKTHKLFNHPTYELVSNIVINRQNTIRVDAHGRTIAPSMTSMQNVVNLSNRSNISAGNPHLNPSYIYDCAIRYIHTNTSRGSTFAISLNYKGSGNFIGDSLVIDKPDFVVTDGITLGEGNQFVRPINIGGYHSLHSKVTYGFPFNALHSNLTLQANVAINILPGMINEKKTPVYRNNYLLSGTLASNISEDLDFCIKCSGQYVQGEFTTKHGKVSNDFFSYDISGNIKYCMKGYYTLTGAVHYTQDQGITADFNDRMLLCNLFIGKRIFKNRLGEISLGVNDLFNSYRKRYVHTINTSGTNNVVNQGIGRYIALQFVWNIRNYHK